MPFGLFQCGLRVCSGSASHMSADIRASRPTAGVFWMRFGFCEVCRCVSGWDVTFLHWSRQFFSWVWSLRATDDCDSQGDAKSTMFQHRTVKKRLAPRSATDRAVIRMRLLRRPETITPKRRAFGSSRSTFGGDTAGSRTVSPFCSCR